MSQCHDTPLIDLIFNKLDKPEEGATKGDGVISLSEWNAGGEKFTKDIFNEIDTPDEEGKKDGKITREEFTKWCNKGDQGNAVDAVSKTFEALDADGNLSLDAGEVGTNLLRLLDPNGDGNIELSELAQITGCTPDDVRLACKSQIKAGTHVKWENGTCVEKQNGGRRRGSARRARGRSTRRARARSARRARGRSGRRSARRSKRARGRRGSRRR